MKLFFAFLFISIAALAHSDGDFETCYQSKDQIYFFDWDHFVNTPEKSVTYFTINDYVQSTGHLIKDCGDQKYIHDVPAEIQKNIADIQDLLPADLYFSLQQISEGAHVRRSEKTPEEFMANHAELFKADRPEVLSKLRYKVGDKFSSAIMNTFIEQLQPKDNDCKSLIGNCDFYLCQEKKNPCGLDGYNLSFGYKYCSGSKFKILNEMKTDFGKKWVTGVFKCLQEKSVKISETENQCADIKKESYSSHPDCYVKAGFCRLKGAEKAHIFSLIKKEILSFKTLAQGVQIIKQCAGEK